MKQLRKNIRLALMMLVIPLLLLSACGTNQDGGSGNENGGETINFADAGWNSIRVHNQIARTIIEEGYGHKTDVTTGSMPITFLGLRQGDIDVYMEVWSRSLGDKFQQAIDEGDIKNVSVNFGGTTRGYFVPTYMIEGDPERGIEPMAPDLKSVKDLPDYWELFKNSSNDDHGRIIGAPSSWASDKILREKMKTYNLDEVYNYFGPGSGTGLTTSLVKAYEAGDPWVGYYYGPSWVLGKYDLTLLKEPDFNPEIWNKNHGTAFPSKEIPIAVNSESAEKFPKVVEFLSHYETSSDLTNEALVYMEENDASAEETAKWWMKKHTDLWTQWVPEDVAKKVNEALQ
jgi:glycine betaine/proline transport system substrate-binding protein